MSTTKNIFITGSTGFLGGYVVDEFRRAGYEIVAAGRKAGRLKELEAGHVHTVALNLNQLDQYHEPLETVVHVAALSSPWGAWNDFLKHNVEGTQRVIDMCLTNGAKRLVYVSSPSIYSGKGHRLNIYEADFDPANHLNHYIRSKIMAEQLVARAQEQGLETVIIRPRGLFGIGDTSIFPRLLQANDRLGIPLFNGGDNLIDITCVENAALGLRLAAESPVASGRIYNLTNGEPRRFKHVLDAVFAGISQTPRYRAMNASAMYSLAAISEAIYRFLPLRREPLLTRYTIATLAFSQTLDISAAQRDLGYRPTITLDEGIARYAASYRQSHS